MNRPAAILVLVLGLIVATSVTAGTVTTLAAIPANGGITADSKGDLYAANFGNSGSSQLPRSIWKLSPTSAFSPFVFATGIIVGSGNDFDSQDNLFQSNFGASRISRIDPAGNVTTFSNNVSGPIGIAIDPNDTLFVANCQGNNISRITAAGQASIFSTSNVYSCPNGMVRATDGTLYVINFNDGRIFSINQNGTPTQFAQVTSPGGHLAIAKGRLYATSFGGHQVIGFSLDPSTLGRQEVTIGTGVALTANGDFTSAAFNSPNGLTADAAEENLYVTEQGGVRTIALEDAGITVSPQAVDFGALTVGQSNSMAVDVGNDGIGPLTFSSITTGGGDGLSISADSCTGVSLSTGETCSVTVTWAPTTGGDFSSTLDIASNDPGGTINVPLIGSAQEVPAPRIVVTDEISFDDLMIGEEGQRGLRIRNRGTLPLNVVDIVLTENQIVVRRMMDGSTRPMIEGLQDDVSTENFTVTRKCGVIEIDDGCTEVLMFHPLTPGEKTAAVGIDTDDPLTPRAVVLLKGTASEDSDGIPDAIEDGAANSGDGNNDGTADRSQPDVGSLPDGGGLYQTLVSVDALPLAEVEMVSNPSPADTPTSVNFDQGFVSFHVTNAPATAVTVTLTLEPNAAPGQFFAYGGEPANTADHWYDFAFDGTTGAQVTGNVVSLTLIDGGRGDGDLAADGTITVLGGAATTPPPPPPPAPAPNPTGGGGGGGGGGAIGWLLLAVLLPGVRRLRAIVRGLPGGR